MSEDDGPESSCDTVEGSPTSERSTSPQGNNTFHYLGNSNRNNRPPLAAMVAPMPPPAVQNRRPCNIRTMVVPPMTVQNNNSQGTEDHFKRTSQCCLFLSYCIILLFDESWVGKLHKCSCENKACSLTQKVYFICVCHLSHLLCGLSLVLLAASALQVIGKHWGLITP